MVHEWVPHTFVWKKDPQTKRIAPDTSIPSRQELRTLQDSFNQFYPEHKVDLKRENPKFNWLTGLQHTQIVNFVVKCGDDIAVNFVEETEYCRVQKCIQVTINNKSYLFYFLFWYSVVSRPLRLPPFSFAKVVTKWNESNADLAPLIPRQIQERVLMLHHCKRTCTNKRCHGNCLCVSLCRIKQFCPTHSNFSCFSATCSSKLITQDTHYDSNTEYIVIDKSCDFHNVL